MDTGLGTSAARDPLTPYSDLKGLAVHDAEDLLTGHVYAILTETDTGLIRYLDVELDGKHRHVLVPVGHARLEQSPAGGRRIRLRAATLDDLTTVPPFNPAEVSWSEPDHARELLAAHGRVFRGDRYYAHPAFDHRSLFVGAHPIVPASEAGPDHVEELELLSQSKLFKLAGGEPDIVGWCMVGADEIVIGTIDDLLIDTQALNARYVVVRIEGARVLVPVGYVELGDHVVTVPGLTLAEVAALPHFDELPLTRRFEEELLAAIERALDARNPFLRVDYSDREIVA